MASELTMLAIGAAGAFARAGVPFPLPARWEEDYKPGEHDDVVVRAMNADDEDDAERKLRERVKNRGLHKAADRVIARRMLEWVLYEEDPTSRWPDMWRMGLQYIAEYLFPPASIILEYEDEARAFADDVNRSSRATFRREWDERIDRAVRKAGYTPKETT